MPLYTEHIDSGISRVVPDAQGKPIQATDAKGAETLSSYDKLQRPVYAWAKNNNSDSLRMLMFTRYGEEATNPLDHNLLGKPWQQYDEAGKMLMPEYDFKGNLLEKTRNVISNATLKTALDNYEAFLVDWTMLPSILDSFDYTTSSEYDALNRVTKLTLPEDVETQRKEIIPTYNSAGALEKVEFENEIYVENIAYNAKGQRILLALGNQIMTRYTYDTQTFRLLRQRSEKYIRTHLNGMITYAYDSGSNKQDDAFNYDLVGNILNIISQLNDCGIAGSLDGANKLNRSFSYDPLYRLLAATGRESDTQEQNDYLYADAPMPGSPNANNVRAYTRKYTYDKIGNILKMQQIASGNSFTRNFVYNTGVNTLQKIETGSSATIEAFTYDPCGNQLTAGTSRHYAWDTANQLQVYKNQAGSSNPTVFAQYQYAGGSRVSKMVRTGTDVSPIYERIIYIDGVFEYHKLENDSTYEKNYVHVMDDASRICTVRINVPSQTYPGDISESITYILEDQIGSSVARLNTDGSIIDKEEYYPFGDSSLRTFTKKSYRYVGKEKDAESGLYYYGARYYAAWTCRFISIDPLASDYPFYTPYNYAGNKPINRIDIDGMQEENASPAPTGGNDHQNGNINGNAPNQTTAQTQVHSVQKGDTISGLSEKYGVSQDAIRQANPQTQERGQADQINIGEDLNIPNSVEYNSQDYSWSSSSEKSTELASPNYMNSLSLPVVSDKNTESFGAGVLVFSAGVEIATTNSTTMQSVGFGIETGLMVDLKNLNMNTFYTTKEPTQGKLNQSFSIFGQVSYAKGDNMAIDNRTLEGPGLEQQSELILGYSRSTDINHTYIMHGFNIGLGVDIGLSNWNTNTVILQRK